MDALDEKPRSTSSKNAPSRSAPVGAYLKSFTVDGSIGPVGSFAGPDQHRKAGNEDVSQLARRDVPGISPSKIVAPLCARVVGVFFSHSDIRAP